METQTHNLSRRIRRHVLSFLSAGALIAITPMAKADPASELASFSVFNNVDLAQLSKSEVKTLRGPRMGNGRYLSVQTAYVVPHAPAEQLAKMKSWSPARHSELKVFMHSESATNFSRLQNAPDHAAVRYLSSATAQNSSDLHLSSSERKQLASVGAPAAGGAMPAAIVSFWDKILTARTQAFASGGSSAQPPYEHTSPAIRPGEELNGLLQRQDKIRKQFSELLGATGIGRGGGSSKPDQYWELQSVDERGVLSLGAFYSRAGAGGTQQTANVHYYASGGYYASLTLHQLWPVEVGGRAATLVWRGDMVSSGSVGSLRGIERMAAESTMIKDISKSVAFFRRDTGGVR